MPISMQLQDLDSKINSMIESRVSEILSRGEVSLVSPVITGTATYNGNELTNMPGSMKRLAGLNPCTSSTDTKETWKKLGSGVYWITEFGVLQNHQHNMALC